MSSNEQGGKDTERRLATLQDEFRQQLPARTREIEELWAQARDGEHPEALANLLSKTHDLAGSAGNLGYPEVSEACQALQRQIHALEANNRAFTETRDRVTHALVQMLARTVASTVDYPRPLERPVRDTAGDDTPLVYLLDDDPQMCEYIALHLTQAGYQVETLQSVAALKSALHRRRPAALLMDMMLPEGKLAGAKALIAIRAAHPLPLPVIFLSARSDMAARVAAVRAGADAYLTKPLDVDQLRRLLGLLAGPAAKAPRVLIVDDDRFQGETSAAILETAGMETHWLAEPGKILETLQAFKPDLVLMDLYMPSINGAELAAMMRQHLDWADLPVLFLSGETDPRRQASALRRGGDDFLVKPVAPDALIEAVSLRLRRAVLRRTMSVAPPQQCANVQGRLIQTLDGTPPDTCSGLMLLSLDNSEALGDALGLRGMNELIFQLEKRMRQHLADKQYVGRFGGAAFAVILNGTDTDAIRAKAQQLCQAISAVPLEVEGAERYVSCSAGIAVKEPEINGNELLIRADVAALKARRGGTNRIHVHDSKADEAAAAAELQRQAAEIEQALAEGRLRLAFQPIVALKEHPPSYYEALVRLHDANNKEMAPAVFVPVAEQAGLIKQIDRWVVTRVMEIAQAEESMGGAECYFIKLSGQSLADPAFAPWLEKCLIKSSQLGSHFTLEFREDDLHALGETARDNLANLRKRGFNLLIDHFKGDERSVQLLHLIRPNFVRLGRQTMASVASVPEHRDQLKEAIRAAHALGAEVIGAYVEDTQTLASAWHVDADYMQGFFAQPPSELMGYDFSEVVV